MYVFFISDILKHTSKSNPDHCALEAALASIREVMTHINEDKRRTESQLAVFDIFNDIENCPVRCCRIFYFVYLLETKSFSLKQPVFAEFLV